MKRTAAASIIILITITRMQTTIIVQQSINLFCKCYVLFSLLRSISTDEFILSWFQGSSVLSVPWSSLAPSHLQHPPNMFVFSTLHQCNHFGWLKSVTMHLCKSSTWISINVEKRKIMKLWNLYMFLLIFPNDDIQSKLQHIHYNQPLSCIHCTLTSSLTHKVPSHVQHDPPSCYLLDFKH